MIDFEALANECGLKFYDDEMVNENNTKIYRVYVYKENGSITLDDCAKFSNLISPILDVKSLIEGKYSLEVSSPGLERNLRKIEHFKKSINELVKIKTSSNQILKGKIVSVIDDKISLDSGEAIEFGNIKSAKTYIDWENG